jgi:cytochrome P450 family 26 subfamily A
VIQGQTSIINYKVIIFQGKHAREELLELIGKHLEELPHKPRDQRLHLMRDIMERHLAIGSELQDKSDLKNMALELAFGSHATISSCLCSVLMYLGNQKEVFDEVRQELNTSRLCHPTCRDDVITYDDVMSMTYVHHVVKEVLRISPPIAGSFRRTLKPIKVAVG